MHAWREDMDSFFRAIRDPALLPDGVAAGPHYPIADAVDIYHNNYRGNLQDALASAYPVAKQIVGAAFFRRLAQQYISRYPSRSGNLHDYGGEMSAFMAEMAPLHHLPYLADVAALDWACHLAYYAPDAAVFDLARLQAIAADQYPELRWTCHPSCRVLYSPYPLLEIWQTHQPCAPEDFKIDLDSGGGHVLVRRHNNEVTVSALPSAPAQWMQSVQSGATLGAATSAVLAAFPDFDLPDSLSGFIAQGILVDCALPQIP